MGSPVAAQKSASLAASARVKRLERSRKTTCFASSSRYITPNRGHSDRGTRRDPRCPGNEEHFGAHVHVRQRVLNMEFSFLLLANMSDNQACATTLIIEPS